MTDLIRARGRRTLMGGTFGHQEVTGDLRMAVSYKASYDRISFKDSRMEKGDYRGVSFTNCTFEGCQLDLCDFNGATFKVCAFTNCQLDLATFHSAIIEDTTFAMGRAEYASFWNATLRRVRFDLNLHGADLRFAAAEELDYGDSNLWGASININCVNFVDREASDRQMQILLALIASTRGNDGTRAKLKEIVSPRYLQMMEKLKGGK